MWRLSCWSSPEPACWSKRGMNRGRWSNGTRPQERCWSTMWGRWMPWTFHPLCALIELRDAWWLADHKWLNIWTCSWKWLGNDKMTHVNPNRLLEMAERLKLKFYSPGCFDIVVNDRYQIIERSQLKSRVWPAFGHGKKHQILGSLCPAKFKRPKVYDPENWWWLSTRLWHLQGFYPTWNHYWELLGTFSGVDLPHTNLSQIFRFVHGTHCILHRWQRRKFLHKSMAKMGEALTVDQIFFGRS